MKKLQRNCLLFLFLCSVFSVQSQNTFGFRAGSTFASFAGIEDDGNLGGDLKAILGFQIGAVYEINITNKIAIQPEVLFIQKGFKLTGIAEESGLSYKFKSKFVVNYLEFPLLFKYKFGDPEEVRLYAVAGPSFAYAMNAHNVARVTALGQTNRERQPADLDELAYNRFEVSATLGLGFSVPTDPGALFFEARYLLGLTNLNEEGGKDSANYNRGVGFTMGYKVSIADIED